MERPIPVLEMMRLLVSRRECLRLLARIPLVIRGLTGMLQHNVMLNVKDTINPRRRQLHKRKRRAKRRPRLLGRRSRARRRLLLLGRRSRARRRPLLLGRRIRARRHKELVEFVRRSLWQTSQVKIPVVIAALRMPLMVVRSLRTRRLIPSARRKETKTNRMLFNTRFII